MAGVTKQEILDALAKVTEPKTGKDIVSAGMIQGLQVKDGHVAFAIEVDPKQGAQLEPMRKLAEEVVYAIKGVISATVVLTAETAGGGGGGAAAPAG
ncbi:MAG: iron-sulfur cluster assembly protein, partial [Proteobacteria bacterium]|nr:iron-sulfur cluster assembly protein [Pseudomonadota bacterium]